MPPETLVDFFNERICSPSNFLIYDDSLRTYTYSYDEIRRAAQAFARRLTSFGFGPGDKVVVWSENRPEWVVAFWGCLLSRGVVVPVDYRASPDLLARVVDIVDARVLLLGEDVPTPDFSSRGQLQVLALSELVSDIGPQPSVSGPPRLTTGTGSEASAELAEIIFTSGATADPKGVQLTHHNILANIVPVEREVLKYRKYARPFYPLRFLNLLPLSHMFGQAMATFIPPMLGGVTVFMRGYNPAEIIRQIHDRRISVLVCVPKMLEVLREHVERVIPSAADSAAPARARRRALVATPRSSPVVRPQVLGLCRRGCAARPGSRGLLVWPRVLGRPGLRSHGDSANRHAQSPIQSAARIRRNSDRGSGAQDRAGRRNPGAGGQRDKRLLQRAQRHGRRVFRRVVSDWRHWQHR